MKWLKELFSLSPPTPAEIPLEARPRRPKKRGVSPAEREAKAERYRAEMRIAKAATATRDQRRAEEIGVTHYIWRSAGDERVCPTCAKNDGRRFSWSKPPASGHPGLTTCCDMGWCRCYAEAILPAMTAAEIRRLG